MGDSNSDSTDSSNGDEECQRRNSAAAKAGKISPAIVTRPNASNGFWLSCLIPLAFGAHYLQDAHCDLYQSYNVLTVAAFGMCVESLCFFMYMFVHTGLQLKLLISFAPGLFTILLFRVLLLKSWTYAIFYGFSITFFYQNAYINVLRGLPRCFSFGEAAVLMQGLMLFILSVILQLPKSFLLPPDDEFDQLNMIMMSALFSLLLTCWLIQKFKFLQKSFGFYPSMAALVIAVTCIPVTEPLPVIALFNFIISDKSRLYIIAFYVVLVVLTICAIWWQLRDGQKATTCVRKIFHLLIVLVYMPGVIYQCSFLYIASGVALSILTVVELMRVVNVPPLAKALNNAFACYSDDKDAGNLALTPFCLLIGCSLPIWIYPCPCGSMDIIPNYDILPLLSGILSIGIGDAAASIVGSQYGRTKWKNCSRTLEGTIAFVVSIILTVLTLQLCGYIPMSLQRWLLVVAATLASALVEAYTNQIDNLVLPLIFYTIVILG